MRIDNRPFSVIQKVYNQQQKIVVSERVQQQSKEEDRINFSAEAKIWSSAFQAIRSQSDHNEKKIERIGEAIKNGTYRVSNEDIAKKLYYESIFDKKV